MSSTTVFSRLRREIGIKRCIIIDGNVGDVYLHSNKTVDLRAYLSSILTELEYENVYYWDRVDGLDGDLSRLSLTEEIKVEGEPYDLGDTDIPKSPHPPTGTGKYEKPEEIFPIILRDMKKPTKKIAFILNWADYLFSPKSNALSDEERKNLTLLSKAIKNEKPEYSNTDVNESTVIIITDKLAAIPISFYQGNPDVSTVTLPRPDRLEREQLLKKIEGNFVLKLPKANETITTSEKKNEYIDILDDFTFREIIQMARLSRKEGDGKDKLDFEKLFYLFKYGEKDNPWEKLAPETVKNIREKLSERVIGQKEAVDKVAKVVVKAYMGLTGLHKASSRSMPKGVLFFVGPTGVGKTELSKALAYNLFGDDQACIRFDMSEYAQENSDQKLIGAPPGYVGYEEGGRLTNAVREKPFSVILFDEIEKAAKPNPRILDIFLQILEDGRLTDGKGETVYFSDCVIIFTSNLGADKIDMDIDDKGAADFFLTTVKDYFDNTIQRPELMGRIGYSNIVPFNRIRDKDFLAKITRSKLEPIKKAIKEKYRLSLVFDDEQRFVDYITEKVDPAKGGREVLNVINDVLLDSLAAFLFENRDELVSFKDAKIMGSTEKDGVHFEFEP